MPVTGNNHIARENILSIQADLNGFSFSVHDAAGNCLALQHYDYTINDYNDLDNEIHAIFRRDDRLKQSYRKCSCLFLSEKSTLIPSSLFNPQRLRSYLDFVAPLDELDEIHFRQLCSMPEATAVFAIPSPMAATVSMYQPNTIFHHQCIHIISRLRELQPANGLYLHLSSKLASVALYTGGRIELYNTFGIHAFADAIYYMSCLLQQWQLLPAGTTVYLSGRLQDSDESLLRTYFPSVQKISAASIAKAFGERNGIEYQLLHSINTCES